MAPVKDRQNSKIPVLLKSSRLFIFGSKDSNAGQANDFKRVQKTCHSINVRLEEKRRITKMPIKPRSCLKQERTKFLLQPCHNEQNVKISTSKSFKASGPIVTPKNNSSAIQKPIKPTLIASKAAVTFTPCGDSLRSILTGPRVIIDEFDAPKFNSLHEKIENDLQPRLSIYRSHNKLLRIPLTSQADDNSGSGYVNGVVLPLPSSSLLQSAKTCKPAIVTPSNLSGRRKSIYQSQSPIRWLKGSLFHDLKKNASPALMSHHIDMKRSVIKENIDPMIRNQSSTLGKTSKKENRRNSTQFRDEFVHYDFDCLRQKRDHMSRKLKVLDEVLKEKIKQEKFQMSDDSIIREKSDALIPRLEILERIDEFSENSTPENIPPYTNQPMASSTTTQAGPFNDSLRLGVNFSNPSYVQKKIPAVKINETLDDKEKSHHFQSSNLKRANTSNFFRSPFTPGTLMKPHAAVNEGQLQTSFGLKTPIPIKSQSHTEMGNDRNNLEQNELRMEEHEEILEPSVVTVGRRSALMAIDVSRLAPIRTPLTKIKESTAQRLSVSYRKTSSPIEESYEVTNLSKKSVTTSNQQHPVISSVVSPLSPARLDFSLFESPIVEQVEESKSAKSDFHGSTLPLRRLQDKFDDSFNKVCDLEVEGGFKNLRISDTSSQQDDVLMKIFNHDFDDIPISKFPLFYRPAAPLAKVLSQGDETSFMPICDQNQRPR